MIAVLDRDDEQILTADDLRVAVEAGLKAAGVTLSELAEQARAGSFSSELARLLWLAIQDVVPTA